MRDENQICGDLGVGLFWISDYPPKKWRASNPCRWKDHGNDVIDSLVYVSIRRGTPQLIHSDNSSEYFAEIIRQRFKELNVQTTFSEHGSPRKNEYIESFDGKLRDNLLMRKIIDTIAEILAITDQWRNHFNRISPHSAIGYRPPAPESFIPDAVLRPTVNGKMKFTIMRFILALPKNLR